MYHVAWSRQSREVPEQRERKNGYTKAPAASATAGIAAAAVCASGGGAISPALSAPIDNERVDVRSWRMDTGCKYDLTSRGAIPRAHDSLINDAERPLALSTANGYLYILDNVERGANPILVGQ